MLTPQLEGIIGPRKCRCGAILPPDSLNLCPSCQNPSGASHPNDLDAMTIVEPLSVHEATSAAIDSQGDRPRAFVSPGGRFGGYEIIRSLGKGGMGAVYEAEHLESERRVALKLLDRSLDSSEARMRFFREGRLAASINHPNTVYIYGTEEIEGVPAISMELVRRGTLKDLVDQKGPLPTAQAVDLILQVIRGLDAAHRGGILHRDVKPSNCFIDTDETVKVGDFGLSIVTDSRSEAQLTISGAFIGTPAFASPEQLRGDALDVRSDIYSVGVTLYFLLTGRTPFAAENMVKLLAITLEQPPDSPAKWRPELPHALVRAVLRALEKQPSARFSSYEEFEAALQAFSSVAPTPADLRTRFSAGVLDLVLVSYLPAQIAIALYYIPTSRAIDSKRVKQFDDLLLQSGAYWVFAALPFLYFALAEGIWGKSVGKATLGLQLVRTNGDHPGLGLASLRALIFRLIPAIPPLLAMGKERHVVVLASVAATILLAAMFSTARARNGFAGWHDLLSRTRVVRKRMQAPRRELHIHDPAAPSQDSPVASLGPYMVLGNLGENPEWLNGYDPVLKRKIWIRKCPEGTPPVLEKLRILGRPGRARWLAGRRRSAENWDAYAAHSGQALLSAIQKPQPWHVVRFWLLDLAQEIRSGLLDGSPAPILSPDRVWITGEGRAILLDFPAPGSSPTAGSANTAPLNGTQFEAGRSFIGAVAKLCLAGRDPDPTPGLTPPPPLHGGSFLNSLPSLDTPNRLVDRLEPLLTMPTEVSRFARFKVVLGSLLIPLIVLILGCGVGIQQNWGRSDFQGVAFLALAVWILFTIIPSLACSLIFGDGPLLRRMGLATVRNDGLPASRLRVFYRMTLTWSPALLSLFLMLKGPKHYIPLLIAPPLLLMLICAVFAVLHPQRGIQDRLAGTWIVLR